MATKDIQVIIKEIVAAIDKTLRITKIEGGELASSKLFVCGFKWLKVGMTVLDDQDRDAKVTEINTDEGWISISKNPNFTWESTVLTIVKDIYFHPGTPLDVNGQWLNKSRNEEDKSPFVWLVEPTPEEFFHNDQATPYERMSEIHLMFMDITDLPRYTAEDHHRLVLQPLQAWEDGFYEVIEKNEMFLYGKPFTTFGKIKTSNRKSISRFGKETQDGFERNIIDSNLSARDNRFTLPVIKACNC